MQAAALVKCQQCAHHAPTQQNWSGRHEDREQDAPAPLRAGRLAAEGKENQLVVIGEKGRSQLQRDMRDSIAATVADTNKVRITFPQVWAWALSSFPPRPAAELRGQVAV